MARTITLNFETDDQVVIKREGDGRLWTVVCATVDGGDISYEVERPSDTLAGARTLTFCDQDDLALPGQSTLKLRWMTCPKCGSYSMTRDACARWEADADDWSLSSVYDVMTCDDCGAETYEARVTDVPPPIKEA